METRNDSSQSSPPYRKVICSQQGQDLVIQSKSHRPRKFQGSAPHGGTPNKPYGFKPFHSSSNSNQGKPHKGKENFNSKQHPPKSPVAIGGSGDMVCHKFTQQSKFCGFPECKYEHALLGVGREVRLQGKWPLLQEGLHPAGAAPMQKGQLAVFTEEGQILLFELEPEIQLVGKTLVEGSIRLVKAFPELQQALCVAFERKSLLGQTVHLQVIMPGQVLSSDQVLSHSISDVEYLACEQLLLTSSLDCTLSLWALSPATQHLKRLSCQPLREPVTRMKFLPEGKMVVCGTATGGLMLWKVGGGGVEQQEMMTWQKKVNEGMITWVQVEEGVVLTGDVMGRLMATSLSCLVSPSPDPDESMSPVRSSSSTIPSPTSSSVCSAFTLNPSAPLALFSLSSGAICFKNFRQNGHTQSFRAVHVPPGLSSSFLAAWPHPSRQQFFSFGVDGVLRQWALA